MKHNFMTSSGEESYKYQGWLFQEEVNLMAKMIMEAPL